MPRPSSAQVEFGRSGYPRGFGLRVGAEQGSVTAELVAVLPIVAVLIGLLAVVGAGQIQRVGLVVAAAQAARSFSIGESAPPAIEGITVRRSNGESGMVCATAANQLRVLNLGVLELSEQSCMRELGQ